MVSISANQTVAANAQTHSLEEKRKSAIKGAFFPEYIDMLDIYLPVVVLSPVLFYLQPPNLSEGAATIICLARLYHHITRPPSGCAIVRYGGG